MKLLIATGNPGKFKEISSALSNLPLTFLSLKEVNADSSGLIEDGETYQENAYKKASFFAKQTGLTTLAEDSGIIVNALKGELGVKTRRWGAGDKVTDQEWIDYFLNRMKDIEDRTATFVSCACLVDNKGNLIKIFLGETKGHITKKIRCEMIPGLPMSSCFIPEGETKVYAELTPEEKNKISHRGKAVKQIKDFLQTFLNH